jgi:hypothetical protein
MVRAASFGIERMSKLARLRGGSLLIHLFVAPVVSLGPIASLAKSRMSFSFITNLLSAIIVSTFRKRATSA